MKQLLTNRDFNNSFRQLCRSYASGFPCESLASCIRECQEVLSKNRVGLDSLLVNQLFQVFLEEFSEECFCRIESLGDIRLS